MQSRSESSANENGPQLLSQILINKLNLPEDIFSQSYFYEQSTDDFHNPIYITADNIDFREADGTNDAIYNVIFNNSNLSFILFLNSEIFYCHIKNCNGQYCKFVDSTMFNCHIENSDFSYSTFTGNNRANFFANTPNIINTKLFHCNLSGMFLSKVNLNRSDLSYSDCAQTIFDYANCENVNGDYGNFQGASFKQTVLNNASFNHANLCNSNISEANIIGVNLIKAILDEKTKEFIINFIQAESTKNSLPGSFKPLFDYFSAWRDTHYLHSFFRLQSQPTFEKYAAVLYLIGAETREDFLQRVEKIPDELLISKTGNSLRDAINQVTQSFEVPLRLS